MSSIATASLVLSTTITQASRTAILNALGRGKNDTIEAQLNDKAIWLCPVRDLVTCPYFYQHNPQAVPASVRGLVDIVGVEHSPRYSWCDFVKFRLKQVSQPVQPGNRPSPLGSQEGGVSVARIQKQQKAAV